MTPPSPQRLGYKPQDGATSPASLGRKDGHSGASVSAQYGAQKLENQSAANFILIFTYILLK